MMFGEGYQRHHIPVTVMSPDGRWLLVHVIEGSSGPTEVHVKDLASDGPFKVVVADGVSENWAEFAGDRIVITTNLDAPNKRVVVDDPSTPSVAHWQEVVPERDDVVVQAASPRGGRLAVSYLRNVQPGMAIHELGGEYVRDIEFDTLGSIGAPPASGTVTRCFSPSTPSRAEHYLSTRSRVRGSRTCGLRRPRLLLQPPMRSSRCGSRRAMARASRCSWCMRQTSCGTARRQPF